VKEYIIKGVKHLKKSAFIVALAVFAFFLLFALTEGLTRILIFPIIALAAFAGLYLVKQGERDIENNIKDGVRYTVEDQEAEQWIKHDLAPNTLSYIKQKHWPIIIYGFLFVIGLAYLWSFLTLGSESAVRNTIYVGILFVLLVFYSFVGPRLFNVLYKHIPKPARKYFRNDWLRGYLFLLPLTAAAYLLSPFISAGEPFSVRIASLPSFFLGYTFLFLSGSAVMYLHQETKREEEKRLKKEVKEYLEEKQS
jgi:hypothetical protein